MGESPVATANAVANTNSYGLPNRVVLSECLLSIAAVGLNSLNASQDRNNAGSRVSIGCPSVTCALLPARVAPRTRTRTVDCVPSASRVRMPPSSYAVGTHGADTVVLKS